MPLYKRLPGGQAPTTADIAGLMGPLEAIPAVAGMAAKAVDWDQVAHVNGLLGKTVQLGKRLVRLSSANPDADTGILHTSLGERLTVPLKEFLAKYQELDVPTDPFPEGGVVTASGVPTPRVDSIGVKGGLPAKRTLK